MPAGRPSKYVSAFHVPWARSLARRGLTVAEIADAMDVARSTFYKWLDEDEELSDALNEGRGMADAKVEDSLYKRAIGYTITEKKTIVSAGNDGEQKPARIEITEKEVSPDTTAIIFWLKNRMPRQWRDQSNIAIETADDDEAREKIDAIVSEYLKKKGEE